MGVAIEQGLDRQTYYQTIYLHYVYSPHEIKVIFVNLQNYCFITAVYYSCSIRDANRKPLL